VLKALGRHIQAGGDLSQDAPGVGQYVGRAIQVAQTNASVAMVDGNWVRILHRMFSVGWMADYRYDPRLQQLAQAMVDGAHDSRSLNWAILDLGAMICVPRAPRCGQCPIASRCETGNSGGVSLTEALVRA